jgi:ketosteroid isomerase-like protein
MKPKELATTYFDCWKRRDFDGLRAILADDATFSGPMGTASGDDDYATQLAGSRSASMASPSRRCWPTTTTC